MLTERQYKRGCLMPMCQIKSNCTLFDYVFINDKKMDWIDEAFERLFSLQRLEDKKMGILFKDAYPLMGEVKKYRVVNEDDFDIIPKESLLKRLIENTESQIDTQRRLKQSVVEEYDKRIAELEEKLQRQKKRLKP